MQTHAAVCPGMSSFGPDPFEEEEEDYDDHPQRPDNQRRCPGDYKDRSGYFHHSFGPKLQKLTDEDDIEHFLITFKRIARACRWPRVNWSFHLIPLLTGKACGAYVHMDVNESDEYDKVKAAILTKYDVNPESYRLKFRSVEVEPHESPKELYVRLKGLFGKWIQPGFKTVEEVGELIILEQYLRMVSPELQVELKEHAQNSASEAADLASVYMAAQRKDQPWSYASWKASKDARKPNYYQSQKPPVSTRKLPDKDPSAGPDKKRPICYLCGKEGHTKPACPNNSAKVNQVCCVPKKKQPKVKTN